MTFEQKSRRAGWIAVEDAGFDPASATLAVPSLVAQLALFPGRRMRWQTVEVPLRDGFMGETVSPFRKRVN